MSFDIRVKNEILKMRYPRREELLAFLSGVTHTTSEIVISGGQIGLEISADFDTINRVKSGFEYFFAGYPEMEDPLTFEEEEKFILKFQGDNVFEMLEALQVLDNGYIHKGLPNFDGDEKLKSAYIAGAFIGSGKIKVPHRGKNGYQIEFAFTYEETADEFFALLEGYGILMTKKIFASRTSLVGRNSQIVSDVVNLMNAMESFWFLQDFLVKRTQNEKDNRKINCGVANEDRSVIASVKQVLAIEKLIETGDYINFDENLKSICELRLANPNISLEEMGKMLDPPISKSGVNHRMRKIVKMASEIE